METGHWDLEVFLRWIRASIKLLSFRLLKISFSFLVATYNLLYTLLSLNLNFKLIIP